MTASKDGLNMSDESRYSVMSAFTELGSSIELVIWWYSIAIAGGLIIGAGLLQFL